MEVCNQYDFDSPDISFESCFETFDQDKSETLGLSNFKQLCYALFRNEKNQKYLIRDQNAREIFAIFDRNSDGFLDKEEFEFCWYNWIQTIINPKSALVIVNVQNDFITGSMATKNCPAKHDACTIISSINNLLSTVKFEVVAYTMDWHPKNHISFIDNIQQYKIHKSSKVKAENAELFSIVQFEGPHDEIIEQCLFPKHCVQNTPGAQLHKDLKIVSGARIIKKAMDPYCDAYSGFFDNPKKKETELNSILQDNDITDVYVCGISIDYSVGQTAEDAITLGYRSIIIEDCCVGLDPENYKKVSENFRRNNGLISKSEYVGNMIKGIDRRPELGYCLAMNFR